MSRRSSSDYTFLAVIYLIGLPIVIVIALIQLIIKVIGYFLTRKKNKLDKNIGVTTANCPYCGIKLSKFPGRKTKCKTCGKYMYVRTRPADGVKILIKEEEIQIINEENDKKYGRDKIPIIDATKEMDFIYKSLTQNYEKLCNYEEILQIEEADRLSVLQWIWERWEYHNSDKELKEAFPKYSSSLIREIYIIETGRVYALYHQLEFIKRYKDSSVKPLVYISSNSLYNQGSDKRYFCKIEDIPNLYSYLIQNRDNFGYTTLNFMAAPFEYFVSKCEYDYLYFWGVNEFVKISPKQLKEYCKKNRLGYPFE